MDQEILCLEGIHKEHHFRQLLVAVCRCYHVCVENINWAPGSKVWTGIQWYSLALDVKLFERSVSILRHVLIVYVLVRLPHSL